MIGSSSSSGAGRGKEVERQQGKEVERLKCRSRH